jgi:hypothetical protein
MGALSIREIGRALVVIVDEDIIVAESRAAHNHRIY